MTTITLDDTTSQRTSTSTHGKPSILIIGGLGYIGRYLALYIHKNDLASEVRLVDKQLPELAWLSPRFAEACSRDKFMQADASRDDSIPRIFTRPSPNAHLPYDLVFNCGSGTPLLSQPDSFYQHRHHALSLTLARACAARHVPCLIELSSGLIYGSPSNHTPHTETSKPKPGNAFAMWKWQAEQDLAKIEGLHAVVLRLANVWGEEVMGGGLATAIGMARCWKEEGVGMKWVGEKEKRVDVVHVEDVVRGMWRAAMWYVEQTGQVVGAGLARDEAKNRSQSEQQANGAASAARKEGTNDSSTVPGNGTAITKEVEAGIAALSVGEAQQAPTATASASAPSSDPSAQSTSTADPAQHPQPALNPPKPPAPTPQPQLQPPPHHQPHPPKPPLRPLPTFNLTSPSPLTQAHLSALLSTHFSITSTFPSPLLSPFLRLNLSSILADTNDDLLSIWSELLEKAGVKRPGPIGPFVEKEWVEKGGEMCLDGREFVRRVGFGYEHGGQLDGDSVKGIVESWRRLGWWP